MPPTLTEDLPSNVRSVYDKAVSFFESKQYPKASKLADSILQTHPKHAESSAVKGLCLANMDQKEEAYKLIQHALETNMKSSVGWRAYAVLHRRDRNYLEAMKCFNLSLTHDKDNTQLMHELAGLQLRLRQYDSWTETSRKLLVAESKNKSNWLSFAVGCYLTKNYTKALSLLDSYIKTLQEAGEWKSSYSVSEVLLFYSQVLEESGEPKKVLEHLETHADLIGDPIAVEEIRSRAYGNSGEQGKAIKSWEALIDFVPENHRYHYGLRKALGLELKPGHTYTPAQITQLTTLYKKLHTKYPKVHAVERLPLDFLAGKEFRAAFKKYVSRRLNNPSLFQDIHDLYDDESKRNIMTKLILEIYQELEASGRLFPEDLEDSQPPSVLMRVLYYLGQHFIKLEDYVNALKSINRAMAHTPTNIDLYLLKARVYKHAGDYDTAFRLMNTSRELDTADRYLNTKCVRYALRSDRTERALEIAGLFLQGEVEKGLYDNQCSWFWVLAGDSYLRQNRLGKAIKNFKFVLEHYDQYLDDPSEFHAYCGQKGFLRAWVQMIRWAETAKDHHFFIQAASGIVEAYMQLHDQQQQQQEKEGEASEASAEEKSRDADDEKAAQHEKTKAPLEEAAKILEDFLSNCPTHQDGLSLAVRLYSKMDQLDKAATSLRALLELPEEERPASSAAAVLAFHTALQRTAEHPEKVQELISEHPVLQAKTLAEVVELHQTFLQADSVSSHTPLAWCLSLVRALSSAGEARQALDLISQSIDRISRSPWSEAAGIRDVIVRMSSDPGIKAPAQEALSSWDQAVAAVWGFFRPVEVKKTA